MHTSFLLCLAQITAVSLLALILARVTLARLPHVAATLCALGIALSAFIAVAAFLPIPRPWNVKQVVPTFAASTSHAIRGTNSLSRNQGPQSALLDGEDRSGRSGGMFRLDLAGVLIGEHAMPALGVPTLPSVVTWLIVLVWVVLLLRLFHGLRAIVALHRTSQLCSSNALDSRVIAIANQSGCRVMPVIRETSQIQSPCVTWLQPHVIYIPASFADWSGDEQEVAISHEIAHALRYDAFHRVWANLLAGFLWFHPLVTVLYRQLKIAQEMAADREAASHLGDVASYARGLSRLALRMDASKMPTTLTSLVSVTSHNMIRRITMLNSMDGLRTRQSTWHGRFCAILLVGLGVAAVCFADDEQSGEPPVARVATTRSSRGKTESTVTKAFTRPRTEPWKAVGAGRGYAMFRPSELLLNDSLQPVADNISEYFLRDATSPKIGLSIDNVALVHLRTFFEKSEHALRYRIDAVDVRSHRPIDWTAASDAIHMATVAPEESAGIQRAREVLGNRGVSDHVRIISAKHAGLTRTTERLQQVWSKVDGGSFALAMFVGDEDGLALLSQIDAVAIGVDMGTVPQDRHAVRLAFAPKAEQTADELVNLIMESRQALLADPDAALEQDWGPAVVGLFKDLAGQQVSFERFDNGNTVVVSGEISSTALAAVFESI